jgi:hypothetical protein
VSDYYAESNMESSMLLFNKRMVYGARFKDAPRNIVDFNFGEKMFYGRIDHYHAPIFATAGIGNPFKYYEGKLEMNALGFVADIFNEMARKFQLAAQGGQIRSDDPYLSNLKAYAAWTPAEKLYSDYFKIYSGVIAKRFINQNIEVLNFSHFISELMGIIATASSDIPYTFAAFIKSRRCSIMATGLAIEIADLDYANDDEKIMQLVNSPNWDFFVNACNTYGFMIDQNVPWRIVMDIAAEDVIQYAFGGAGTATDILDVYFSPAMSYQRTRFVPDLFRLYNRVKKRSVTTYEYCNASGKSIPHVRYPVEYKSVQQLIKSYNKKYWDSLYLQIRLMEEKPDMSKYQRETLIADQLMVLDRAPVSWHFERIINKMIDKAGSFSYYKKALTARTAKQFAGGDISAYTVDLDSVEGSVYIGD